MTVLPTIRKKWSENGRGDSRIAFISRSHTLAWLTPAISECVTRQELTSHFWTLTTYGVQPIWNRCAVCLRLLQRRNWCVATGSVLTVWAQCTAPFSPPAYLHCAAKYRPAASSSAFLSIRFHRQPCPGNLCMNESASTTIVSPFLTI